jgi:uncharacterized protein YceH (UPF0502 family)
MELSVAEGRVLGCLIEKQVTDEEVPSLTLDELRFSCNKATDRDPIVAFDDRTVEDMLLNLKAKGLARYVAAGRGAAPTSYRHRADDRWRLEQAELAVLSILLLRGPQTVDQVWALVDEMCLIENRTGVEVALDTLAGRTPTPLAARLASSGGPDGVSWVEVLTGRYLLDQPRRDVFGPPPATTDRRGSGLPAREPWRPDERFDRRQRRDERDLDRGRDRERARDVEVRNDRDWDEERDRRPDDRDRREAAAVYDLRDRDRDVRERDRVQERDHGPERDRVQDRERDRDRRSERDGHDRATVEPQLAPRPPEPLPRPQQVDPPVPMAVPANQPPRPEPTLADIVDRLANIERRLAGIEAALNSLRSAQNQPPQPQAPPKDPQQSQLKQPPLPSSRNQQAAQLQLNQQQGKAHGQPPPPPPPPSRSHPQGQAPSRSHR